MKEYYITDEDYIDPVWKRDNKTCQRCRKKLTSLFEPYKFFTELLSSLKEISIFKWSRKCWKCGKETPVVTYSFNLKYDYNIGDIPKLDKILREKYPFVKKISSKKFDPVTANFCINCRAFQSNRILINELLQKRVDIDDKLDDLIDTKLPNELELADFNFLEWELKPFEGNLLGHVHHINLNRKDNRLENKILLCPSCHKKLHIELRKKYLANNS